MAPDAEAFLVRFRAFGAAPSAESDLQLFHPDATLFDSGMDRPIRVPEIPEHIGAVLALVPDFHHRHFDTLVLATLLASAQTGASDA